MHPILLLVLPCHQRVPEHQTQRAVFLAIERVLLNQELAWRQRPELLRLQF
jgi:hypothetical protein